MTTVNAHTHARMHSRTLGEHHPNGAGRGSCAGRVHRGIICLWGCSGALGELNVLPGQAPRNTRGRRRDTHSRGPPLRGTHYRSPSHQGARLSVFSPPSERRGCCSRRGIVQRATIIGPVLRLWEAFELVGALATCLSIWNRQGGINLVRTDRLRSPDGGPQTDVRHRVLQGGEEPAPAAQAKAPHSEIICDPP